MTLSLTIFIELLKNNTFCKEVHTEYYENQKSWFCGCHQDTDKRTEI
jgi:hypothetical protein